MKKLALLLPIMLTGCATTQGVGDFGTKVLTAAIHQKCQSEVRSHTYYAYASLVLSDEQKVSITNQVCGCVAEQAPKVLSSSDMLTIATDAKQRPPLIAKAVKGSLQACAAQWFGR